MLRRCTSSSSRDFATKVSDKIFVFSEAVVAHVPSSRFKAGITSALPPKDIKDLEIFHHSREDGFNFDNFALVFNPKNKEASPKTKRRENKQVTKCRDSRGRGIFIARTGVKVSRTQVRTTKSRRQELRRCSRKFTELHTFSTPKTKKQVPKRREKQRSKSQSVGIHVFGEQNRAKRKLEQSCVRQEAKFGFKNRERGCEAGSGLWAVRAS